MFGTLGGPELFLILVVALIVFGPRKLPEIGKSLGKMMAEFRKASNEFKRTIETEVEADKIRWAVARHVKNQIIQARGNILGVILNKRRYYIPSLIYKWL